MPIIVNELIKRRAGSVLDLGCGLGIYGAAIRQWCETDCFRRSIRIIGIEGFDGYRNPNWEHYDDVIVDDIRQVCDRLNEKFAAILMLDVIEHFDKAEGEGLLKKYMNKLNDKGIMLVSTPAVFCEQGAVYDNDLEIHRSLWTVEDFVNNGFQILKNGEKDNFGHLMLVAMHINLN